MNFKLFLTLEENYEIFIRHLASIFKRLPLYGSKQFSVIGQFVGTFTHQVVETSCDLVVKSDALLTLFLHINRLWIPLIFSSIGLLKILVASGTEI